MGRRPPNRGQVGPRGRSQPDPSATAPSTELALRTPSAPALLPSLLAEFDEVDAFLSSAALDSEFAEIAAEIDEAVRSRHAASTRRSYDYWLSRFERWLSKPDTRFRLRDQPSVSPDSILPIDARVEKLVAAWLTDIYLGPTDPDEHEEWLAERGPLAPGTFSIVLAALRARSSDFNSNAWSPSTGFKNWAEGLRRRLRDQHGPIQQAEPLLGFHVSQIAAHLHAFVSPTQLRDRLVFELSYSGLSCAEIARIRLCDLVPPTRSEANSWAESSDSSTGGSPDRDNDGSWTLAVPGQRRRGGHIDEPRLVELAADSDAAAALGAHLKQMGIHPEVLLRAPSSSDLFLVSSTTSNRRAHIREILLRLADLADVAWSPTEGPPSAIDVLAIRQLFDRSLEWPGQLRARRDQLMVLVGYHTALRRSELCALRLRNVSFMPGGVSINIERSKTDQDAIGKKLGISRQAHPAPATATVDLLEQWCALLRSVGADRDTPLFPALDRWGRVLTREVQGELKVYGAIAPQSWSDRLAELAREASVFSGDPDAVDKYERVSGHSLRRGFVTTALLVGADPIAIAKQTRHTDIGMLVRYADELRLLEGVNWSELIFGDPLGDAVNSISSDTEG